MRLLVLSILFLCTGFVTFSETSDSLLYELDQTITKQPEYVKQKWAQIGTLRKELNSAATPQLKYEITNALFEEFKSFIYDSAFAYSSKLLLTAYSLHNESLINASKVKISFTLLSAGMFKEALDTLHSIDSATLTREAKIEFYSAYARTYFDMGQYAQDQHYSSIYSKEGNRYLAYAISFCEPGSINFLLLKGWEYVTHRNIPSAIETFELVLKNNSIEDHQRAIAASSLSYMYRVNKQIEKAKQFLAIAAISDIRSSICETVAIRDLADILYEEGEVDRAYKYVKIALADAYFYGAKHRKIQISNILPIIEGAQLTIEQEQKTNLFYYSFLMTLLFILIIYFSFIIYRQYRKLNQVKIELVHSHKHLQELNSKLQDANKIKEQYIGDFFKLFSGYIDKSEKFKMAIDRKVSQKKIQDIADIVDSINIKSERDELYLNFDTTFLKIFPGFIKNFNALFSKEHQFFVEEHQPLPPELRIFALIRLGINDNEKIAKILSYSVNTIYSYKNRTKSKSFIAREKFEEELMKIRAVS